MQRGLGRGGAFRCLSARKMLGDSCIGCEHCPFYTMFVPGVTYFWTSFHRVVVKVP